MRSGIARSDCDADAQAGSISSADRHTDTVRAHRRIDIGHRNCRSHRTGR
jgi:hypothetical protein